MDDSTKASQNSQIVQIPRISFQKRLFTLEQARELFPIVKKITHAAFVELHPEITRLQYLRSSGADVAELECDLEHRIEAWAKKLTKLGCTVKGLWLVDFDNGDGYYCWKYPEESLDHFHPYDQGFGTRTPIC